MFKHDNLNGRVAVVTGGGGVLRSGFAKDLASQGVKVAVLDLNEAAAQAVANSDRTDLASISSKNCAALYSLSCLAESVQDRDNNYTRFVCLAKQAEIYPGADRTSIIMVLPHKPGSLYRAMSKIHSMGVNIQKLESRPIAERDFDFMFYFDLDVSVYSENFLMLIQQLEEAADTFIYLGSYREV